MWEHRTQALAALEEELKNESSLVLQSFEVVDEAIGHLERHFEHSAYIRVSCLTAVKGRQLAFACYSLILDGCGQEAGALLRPLLECNELLSYLRVVPEGVEQALSGRLPSPGKRASKCSGQFQDLRSYLNQHSSHFDWTVESLKHLVELPSGRVRLSQPFFPHAVRTNLATVFSFTMNLARETALALAHAQIMPVTAESLVNKIRSRIADGYRVIYKRNIEEDL